MSPREQAEQPLAKTTQALAVSEQARQQAEREAQGARECTQRLAARLRALGIDPDA